MTRSIFMSDDNLFVNVATAAFSQVVDDKEGTLYKKELAYQGTFSKRNAKGEKEFELTIDEPLIDHWVDQFNKMKENGVKVPVPEGHEEAASKGRGEVEKLTKEPSEAPERLGQPALFCYVRFKSPEVAADMKDSDVSLFMPPEWTDGRSRRYIRPIRHVAITDYPVIPGLGKFQPVAAGFEISLGNAMTVEELAKQMGIEVPEGSDAGEAILEAWKAGEGEGGEGEEQEYGGAEGMGSGASPEVWEDEEGAESGERRRREEMNYDPPPALSFSPMMVETLADARKAKLSGFLMGPEPRITKPVFDSLCKTYCAPKQVAIALSMEAQGEKPDDFKEVCAALSQMPVIRSGEVTMSQVFEIDKQTGGAESPIAKEAERRAAARRQARR